MESSSSSSALAKDFALPRSNAKFVGFVSTGQDPPGTIVHAIAHTRIPCTFDEFKKNEKSHINFTVVGIKQQGYSCAPYKKDAKGSKNAATDPQLMPKKLFDDLQSVTIGRERLYTSCKAYSFVREEKFDKGPRLDDVFGMLTVGQTFHFKLQKFMYNTKTGKSEVFMPRNEGAAYIEPFTMIEVVFAATAQEQATMGYGLKLERVSELAFSMYSYITPAHVSLLQTTVEDAQRKALASVDPEKGTALTFRACLEHESVGFLAKIENPGAFVGDSDEAGNIYKLSCANEPILPGVHEIDLLRDDMLRMTNAGDDCIFARFVIELAIATNSLYCWVIHNNYYTFNEPKASPFRGIPLVDSDALLRFLIPDPLPFDDSAETASLTMPFEFGNIKDGNRLLVYTKPEKIDGLCGAPWSDDFALCSDKHDVARGYRMYIGTGEKPHLLPLVFVSGGGAGTKRSAQSARIDWAALEREHK